jgi:predicted CoA-binding protein
MGQNGFTNPPDEDIRQLLGSVQTIAVIGLSDNPDRPAYGVAKSLQGFGYRVIPVNPSVDTVLGAEAVDSLSDIDGPVDLVDVFRHPKHVPAIVDECIELSMPALWLQEGVVDEAAALRAREAGLTVVMDRCMYKEYSRLMK